MPPEIGLVNPDLTAECACDRRHADLKVHTPRGFPILRVIKAENLAETDLPALHLGIGLHSGEVVVGNIGSESRAKYGIIGAPVNLTHRIQGEAQGGEVVVSEMVFHHCEAMVAVKRTFQTKLKGIVPTVTLYVVESMREKP